MNNKVYPFHDSLRKSLATIDAPLIALKLIARISFNLDTSYDETLIVMHLSARKESSSKDELCAVLSHVAPRRVKQLISRLVKHRILIEIPAGDIASPSTYTVEPKIPLLILSVDKSTLD
jgi:hypothetical protein